MKLRLAPEEGMADVQFCSDCGQNSFHDAVKRMLYSPGGARSVILWQCEKHPLPDPVVEEVFQ